MELDCSKLMLGGSHRDGLGTIGGSLGTLGPLGYAPGLRVQKLVEAAIPAN